VALRFFADHCISNQVMNALRAAEHVETIDCGLLIENQ
jgi:hypothetical protein